MDEAVTNFKANCMFRNYKPNGPGDLVHIYLLLFIHQCLKRCCEHFTIFALC